MTGADGQYLVDTGVLKQEDLDLAREQTGGGAQDLESAILALGVVDPPALGRAMALRHQLPYAALGSADALLAQGQALSRECCEHWGVMPLTFDRSGTILTLAVSSPERALAMQRVSELLMWPFDLAFTIATQTEVTQALKQREEKATPPSAIGAALMTKRSLKAAPGASGAAKKPLGSGSRPAATSDGEKPASTPRRTLSGLAAASSKRPLLSQPSPTTAKKAFTAAGAAPTTKKKAFTAAGAAPTTKKALIAPAAAVPSAAQISGDLDPAHDLARPLINAVAMLVGARLAAEPAHLNEVRTRARYCQLLAARLHASALELTKAVIAAWVSSIEGRGDLLKHLMLPFDVEEVIHPASHSEELAAHVLALVLSYEAFLLAPGGDTTDVNLVRRHLMVASPDARAHLDTLEAFLQVLMDEQYLRPFDTASGSVLIVDPGASLATQLQQPLSKAGCSVESVVSTSGALDAIGHAIPDLIIADAQSSAKGILGLCQTVRNDHPSVKIIVITAPASEVRGATFLRAGVNDMLVGPVDMEVLFLTVEKNLAAKDEPDAGGRKGFSGSLADMSFNDMIQVLSAGAKNVRIAVTAAAQHGEVYMRAGDIVHCELDGQRGPDAFYALMHWTDGTFVATQCRDFPEATISVSTMSLLMEGARQLDEGITEE